MGFARGEELRRAYQLAGERGFAFMANNIAEANVLMGLLNAYAVRRSDLLVQISPGAAKYNGAGDKAVGLRILCNTVRELAANASILVFINLDHFTIGELSLIEEAIRGRLVSSLMIDASKESFDDNARICRDVVEMASGTGILIEGELGKIKGVEDEIASDEAFYTDPDEAVEFVAKTGIDLLAISIGTQHGVSKGREIELQIDRAQAIDRKLRREGYDVPLVLHGSSGLLPDQVRDVIARGIRKLNKDTHYQYVYGRTACEFYADHAAQIVPPAGVADDVVNLFSGSKWSPDKKVFDPRVVGKAIQERISSIAGELLVQAGSAGHTLAR